MRDSVIQRASDNDIRKLLVVQKFICLYNCFFSIVSGFKKDMSSD